VIAFQVRLVPTRPARPLRTPFVPGASSAPRALQLKGIVREAVACA
jgi:hypothetical protein